MMQTRLRLEPRSMWYSSSARMKASGVSTLSSTRCDRMPSSVVTFTKELRPFVQLLYIFYDYLAFVSATVVGCDELDHQGPILSAHVLLLAIIVLIVLTKRGIRDQLDATVLGEHAGAMAQDAPVAASNPRKLKRCTTNK